jgi:hypothetical protein
MALHVAGKTVSSPVMKFALAILVYLIIALILGVGILLLLQGKPWLLIIGAVAFLLAFARIGCKSH